MREIRGRLLGSGGTNHRAGADGCLAFFLLIPGVGVCWLVVLMV